MYREKLQAVIAENRRRQEQARQLNIRAESEVFPIMSREKLAEWLAQRLNGARRMMEVVDFDNLKLPELEPELVQLVITENPDTVTIEGVTLTIEYGKEYYGGVYCRTSVEEEFARDVKAEAVLLPSGRTVEIRCSGHSAKTFTELVEKLERSRIERCWSTARSAHETSWTSDSQKIIGWLDRVGSSIEITRTDNGNGDPINGFVGLKRYSGYSEWRLFLADTEEKAAEETQKSLEVLLKTAVKESLSIPQEEPWQKHRAWSYSLTELGSALQARFESIVRTHAENLSSNNIEQRIEAIRAQAEKARADIGGEHEKVKGLVDATEAEAESKINTVRDRGLVKSEIEQIREAIRNAREHFDAGAYADAKTDCERASQIAGSLNEVAEVWIRLREEAELACSEVSEGLYEIAHGFELGEIASDEESQQSFNRMEELNASLKLGHYEEVIQKAKKADKWLNFVRTAIKERSRNPPTADALAALRAKFGK